MNMQQILADIAAATTVERIRQIYAWVASAWQDQAAVFRVGQACQAREAELAQYGGVPMPQATHPQNLVLPPPPPPAPAPMGQPPAWQPMPHGQPMQTPRGALPPSPGGFDTAAPRPSPPSPLGTPPRTLAQADQLGLGTIHATGFGGQEAWNVLRAELVNLAAAAWDCGIDLSHIDGLRDVANADPAKVNEIAHMMAEVLRTRTAQTPRASR